MKCLFFPVITFAAYTTYVEIWVTVAVLEFFFALMALMWIDIRGHCLAAGILFTSILRVTGAGVVAYNIRTLPNIGLMVWAQWVAVVGAFFFL